MLQFKERIKSLKFDHNQIDKIINDIFKRSVFNQREAVRNLEKILINRLKQFTPEMEKKHIKLYKKIEDLSSELSVRLNEYIEISDNTQNSKNKLADQQRSTNEEKRVRNIIRQAIVLNQIAVEQYNIATKEELIFIQSIDFFKQIINYLQKNIDQYENKKRGDKNSIMYNLVLPNNNVTDENQESKTFLDFQQFYFANLPDDVKIQLQELDLDFLNPFLSTDSRFFISYLDESEDLEMFLNIVSGYQTFTCNILKNDEDLYQDKNMYLIMLEIIKTIAKKLKVQLKSNLSEANQILIKDLI